ncbi:MAG: P-loop containing nucleoside triphosphate hydrolase protein [Linnemannia gamsii]|nr:MAG: P-loop containing nucleoside triphosphate hydrolase protein [Linnemannia gamsii]
MGLLFSKLLRPADNSTKPLPRRYRVGVFGLDNAGKTAILRRLCPPTPSTSTDSSSTSSLRYPYSRRSTSSLPYSYTIPPPSTLVTGPTMGIDFYHFPLRVLSPRHHHHYLPPLAPPPPPSSCPSPPSPSSPSPSPSSSPLSSPLSSPPSSPPPSSSSDPTFVSDIENVNILFTDLTGQPRFRSMILNGSLIYGSAAFIFVLDASDRSRFEESRDLLYEILNSSRSAYSNHYPLLIFANKMDTLGAMTLVEVKEGLDLGLPEPECPDMKDVAFRDTTPLFPWGSHSYNQYWYENRCYLEAVGVIYVLDTEVKEALWLETAGAEGLRWHVEGSVATTGEGLLEGLAWMAAQWKNERR